DSLKEQLKIAGCEDRLTMPFHRDLIGGKLPYTMGGGLGQSRICMFFLKKAHIGEVQASVWPEAMREECEDCDINLL
ncbi:MAG: aspartate--ammonia ligase, partial [Clostridia bacterium]|nr:aspartate--ammonia ligase [Clostridia bacterium]